MIEPQAQDVSAKLSSIPTRCVEANRSDASQAKFHKAELLRALTTGMIRLWTGLDGLLANRTKRHNEQVFQAIVKCD